MMLQVPFIKPRLLKQILYTTFAFALIYFSFNNLIPAIRYNVLPHQHPVLLDHTRPQPNPNTTSPTVHLVIASTASDDTSWTSRLPIPNLTILRYTSDDPSSPYHPPKPKAREALMYFTYLHDFYDSLPDITLFIHASETPWHVEGTLLRNTSFALSQLDLQQVLRRQYFNLRVTWRAGCPTWIDTRKTLADFDKAEEPFMEEAWRANFGEDDPVPAIDGELEGYKELWEERERLKEEMSFFHAVWDARRAAAAKGRFGEVNDEIERRLSMAWRRGYA
ncbi:hypothetical protein B0A55_02394 [Friedmanniomyces simplex]|uniref:Uncharacterized protein n=1 Tax=Friedmanniomyces simplex TaxID=329884 RepID=A0A4U0XTF6_9PEZI|nr:hypothetical protein B0A55_02394 [Friedmanniomyces simplex]